LPSEKLLGAWIEELTSIRVLDPACGSGNFLYLALRRMLDLWLEATRFASEQGISLVVSKIVSPRQLFGIETEFYAHELASIVVWIGFLQWKHEHAIREDREPILEKLTNIEHGDAILRYDDEGKPYEPEWPKADFIVGNPPFLGDKKMKRELNAPGHPHYVEDLRFLYDGRVPGGADLVCYWYEKAQRYIDERRVKRVGLLATNSIRQGANRSVLDRVVASANIFMAWSDRPWLLDGAAVRVSMVGFDDGSDNEHVLNGHPVGKIHADLTAGDSFVDASPLPENARLCFLGMMKGGLFNISAEVARKMLTAPLNPNGKSNSVVVKRRLIGRDILRRPSDGWVIDFTGLTEAEAALYELPFQYVLQKVKPRRELNDDALMKKEWWLFGRTRPALRKAISSLDRCIVTSEIAKYRLFTWMATDVIPDHRLHVFARRDDYFLGVLQSAIHTDWSLRMGSTFEDRPSYNSDTIFSTFPFPWPPDSEPTEENDARVKAIADAARELVRLRDAWLNPPGISPRELKTRTLTNLYNLRPEWLANAHRTLDEAVFAAYGWPSNLSKEEILARLLALNHERAAAQAEGATAG
jgi:type II restriction/modification system DNA methylase subunit YeeA